MILETKIKLYRRRNEKIFHFNYIIREKHDMGGFKRLFEKIEPLESDWDVVRQFGKVHICCNDPGTSFSPNSTMTYEVEKIEGKWYLTGEWDRFLD